MSDDAYARVVVDTNVILSAALLPESVPARCVDALLTKSRLVLSPATFRELETRIWRPKFDRYISIEIRTALLADLSAASVWIEEMPEAITLQKFSRDINDDKFIHLALAASALRLVSGDADLLSVKRVGDLRIVSPRQMLDEFGA
jgi:uncharacterized protein